VAVLAAVGVLALVSAALPSGARAAGPTLDASGPTGSGDVARTGWYANQAGLNPLLVQTPLVGRLFSTPVVGQVYAQPLLVSPAAPGLCLAVPGVLPLPPRCGTLLVATEADWIYGLDPVTGLVQWSRQIGNAWNASDLGCPDLAPQVGVTSTPTVDPATGIAYLTAKSYLSGTSGPVGYFMHAIDPATGAERPGFPVPIQGTAQNNPAQSFQARMQLQRPALLLLGGVVYAAFSSLCDLPPYQGWIAGVSTAGQITALWTAMGAGNGSGGGIWQSGAGLVSDGPNQILVGIGNGFTSGSPVGHIPGNTPPANLSEAVVRLAVQPGGSLKPTDFFTPTNAQTLDAYDADFGSGAPLALPAPFGTAAIPHLLLEVGKDGYGYLLNRDNLGGVGQGPGGGDAVLAKVGPDGGIWSSAATWPGDGGYVYYPAITPGGGKLVAYHFGIDGRGSPTLTKAGVSAETFGFGSGRPVVTSQGTGSGSSVLWVVHTVDSTGVNSELYAYNPVPVNGVLHLYGHWPIGTASKFSQPGVGANRLYVGTRAGAVLGFGALDPLSLTGLR
jgi:hypothetical protein